MKALGIGVGLVGLVAFVLAFVTQDTTAALLGAGALICAATTVGSAQISSFLKIFVAIFSTETIVFGVVGLASRAGLLPEAVADYVPPDSLPLTVAVFSILVYLAAHIPAVRQVTGIADRFFEATATTTARIWPWRSFVTTERAVGIGLVVLLVLLNQVEVGANLRLTFFRRDLYDALQGYDAPMFWRALLFGFTPWAFAYVGMMLLEYFMQFMLVIRWRRWLTDNFVGRWFASHAHYRLSLAGGETDNPDQRIAEDVFRFINGGSDGVNTAYGVYDLSIQLIANVSMAVSFSILLWDLSAKFTMPGLGLLPPGFLFWVAFVYSVAGIVLVHVIGRPLARLYFERQHMEADFRFSLARAREYSEQIALLDGEGAERHMAGQRFGALIGNFFAVIYRRMKVKAFQELFGQVSPVLPMMLAAPFFFAHSIQLGDLTQTADAFTGLTDALTVFVVLYAALASFKSVADRLVTFNRALDTTRTEGHGPAPETAPAGAAAISVEDLEIALPDGRPAVTVRDLTLTRGENVLLTGPSGAGKSTLLRAIAGIWPFGGGRVRIPAGSRVMVVPQKPYLPIAPLRAAVTYPAPPGSYGDDEIARALADVGLTGLAGGLDREDVWSQRLSGGEQQRIAIARALLARPDWLFLDESTSALDESSEARMYRLLTERLPEVTIVSIAHRGTLAAFHHRRLTMAPAGDRFTLRDEPRVAAE